MAEESAYFKSGVVTSDKQSGDAAPVLSGLAMHRCCLLLLTSTSAWVVGVSDEVGGLAWVLVHEVPHILLHTSVPSGLPMVPQLWGTTTSCCR